MSINVIKVSRHCHLAIVSELERPLSQVVVRVDLIIK